MRTRPLFPIARFAIAGLLAAGAANVLAQAPHYKVLHVFGSGILPDGGTPLDAPTVGPDGALYGTVAAGAGFANPAGAIWRLGANGNYALLHEFLPDPGGGGGPRGALLAGADGWLYGTADGAGLACGAVFRVDPISRFDVVHRFAPDEMCAPRGGVVQGPDGALYGTAGTTNGEAADDGGAVFRISAEGRLQALHSFATHRHADGSAPNAGVTLGPDGALYGTTTLDGPNGGGTLFRVTLDGRFSVLHAFDPQAEGRPLRTTGARLVAGRDGALYGTLGLAGPHGCGSAYRIDTHGRFALLHVFEDKPAEGCSPSGGLAQDAGGDFHGTTQGGGHAGRGTVFRMDGHGRVTLEHEFGPQHKGVAPMGGVTITPSGEVLGTTQDGGTAAGDQGRGVAWRLSRVQ